jgi:phosphate transport system substrate-binding protein
VRLGRALPVMPVSHEAHQIFTRNLSNDIKAGGRPAAGSTAHHPGGSSMWHRSRVSLAAIIFLTAGSAVHAQVSVDPKLPNYKPAPGVSGTIKSVGSDTMNNLMTYWSEGFKKFYPSVKTEIEGKGSTTAPPALIAGTANFGPMSREMKGDEIDAFEKRYGYKPTGLATSIDMLAVYVHKDNKIQGLTLPEVDAIFSKTRKLGHPHDITTWGQLGLGEPLEGAGISLYGRNSASGTYGFFKEHALGKGDFKDTVKEQPGSSSVVQGVASDAAAIGYSGVGYKTEDVNAVPLAAKKGGKYIAATPENAYSGTYPLSRPLLVYVNYKPNTQLDPLRREFIKFIFSKQGQEAVVKDGYYPVTADIAKSALAQVGIK